MQAKTYTLGLDEECKALYDENGNIILGWQEGDDISRVIRTVLSNFNVSLNCKTINVDGDYPSKI
jgi:hypothetical protein